MCTPDRFPALLDVVDILAHPLQVVLALREGFGEVDHGMPALVAAFLSALVWGSDPGLITRVGRIPRPLQATPCSAWRFGHPMFSNSDNSAWGDTMRVGSVGGFWPGEV